MRFSGIFQTISFTVRKRFVNAFLPPPYTVGKPSKNAPKRLKKFAMPSAKTRTLCRRLAASRHQKTALYGHFSASCRFLHSKLQPVGPFLILCAFSQRAPAQTGRGARKTRKSRAKAHCRCYAPEFLFQRRWFSCVNIPKTGFFMPPQRQCWPPIAQKHRRGCRPSYRCTRWYRPYLHLRPHRSA